MNQIVMMDEFQAPETKAAKLQNLNSTYEEEGTEMKYKEKDLALCKSSSEALNVSTRGFSSPTPKCKKSKTIKLSTLYKPIIRRFRSYIR